MTIPYLLSLVLDQQGRPIRVPAQAEAFAAPMLESVKTRTVDQNGGTKRAPYAKPMIVDRRQGVQKHSARQEGQTARGWPDLD